MPREYVLVRTAINDGKVNISTVKAFDSLGEIRYWAECRELSFVKDKSLFGGYYRNPRNGTSFEVQLNPKREAVKVCSIS